MSIDRDMDLIRQNLGVCWQEDIIFDRLTAWEHLELFGTIKNVAKNELEAVINHFLEQMELQQDKHRMASDFSGGMKRKLSFTISMIGDPLIIILDERLLWVFICFHTSG